MAAKRKRGRTWASSRRQKAHGVWFGDFATGTSAPTANTADSDALLSSSDYGAAAPNGTQRERVRVKRIIFDVQWNATGVNAAGGGNFSVDFALVAASGDIMSSIVTSNLNLVSLYDTDSRVIRGHHVVMQEAMQATAVGAYQPPRAPRWRVSLKTNFLLTEPQTLYFYQKRSVDLDSTSDTYEYSYRSRVYFERLN